MLSGLAAGTAAFRVLTGQEAKDKPAPASPPLSNEQLELEQEKEKEREKGPVNLEGYERALKVGGGGR